MSKRVIFILLLLALAMFFGILERETALVQDAMLKDPPIYERLTPCSATVSQRGADESWLTKCYIPRGN